MVVILDDLFGLPVTLGAVVVLEGRPHHPLESLAVTGGAVVVHGGDTVRQDAFNCASVRVCEGLR